MKSPLNPSPRCASLWSILPAVVALLFGSPRLLMQPADPPVNPTPEIGAPTVAPLPEFSEEVTSATLGLLRQLESAHENVDTIHATFTQIRIDKIFEDRIESQGELWFDKPDRFRCDYANPQPMTNLILEEALYMYTPELEQVEFWEFQSAEERQQQLHQLLIGFGFDADELVARYYIRSSADDPKLAEESGGPDRILLHISPRPQYAETSPFRQLKVTIDKSRWLPEKIWYEDVTDAEMTLELNQIDLDEPISQDKFNLKQIVPKGTDFINRRDLS